MSSRINVVRGLILLPLLPVLAGCGVAPQSTADPVFVKEYGHYTYATCPVVRQSEDDSCGLACLVSVCSHWGIEAEEEDLRAKYTPRLEIGYSPLEIKDIAAKLGMDGTYCFFPQSDPIERLTEEVLKGRPLICALKYPREIYFAEDVPLYGDIYRFLAWSFGPVKKHYVVVFGIDNGSFLLMDPAHGYATISTSKLKKSWGAMDYATILCARKE